MNGVKEALEQEIVHTAVAKLLFLVGNACPEARQIGTVFVGILHVMVIMVSYVLFAFMMLNGVAAFIISARGGSIERVEYLQTVSNIMLYPAVFLLTAGIFIGAVWANISWGATGDGTLKRSGL